MPNLTTILEAPIPIFFWWKRKLKKKIGINGNQVQIHALQNQANYSNYLRIIFNINDPSYLNRLSIKIHEYTS